MCGWRGDTKSTAEPGGLASNGQGPPSITDRLRSTADGAQAAADLIGAEPAARSRAGLRLSAAPGRGRLRAPERAAPSGVTWSAQRAGGGAWRGGR